MWVGVRVRVKVRVRVTVRVRVRVLCVGMADHVSDRRVQTDDAHHVLFSYHLLLVPSFHSIMKRSAQTFSLFSSSTLLLIPSVHL